MINLKSTVELHVWQILLAVVVYSFIVVVVLL
jgi:hypothetical protein